jgi:hypothetical protein
MPRFLDPDGRPRVEDGDVADWWDGRVTRRVKVAWVPHRSGVAWISVRRGQNLVQVWISDLEFVREGKGRSMPPWQRGAAVREGRKGVIPPSSQA